jgi:hypothetical protein
VPSEGRGTFAAVARLTACPSCASPFLQPMRCEVQEDGDVVADLRCPDCMTWLQVPLTREDMADLDRCQTEWREEILAAYERSVSESMQELAAILGPALALDLVGADDFAPHPRRAGSTRAAGGATRLPPPAGS